jgi:ribokinase
MADLIIIGSIGLDDISTPFGNVKNVLGGSAVYASYAASFFTQNFTQNNSNNNKQIKQGIVAIAGEDLPIEHFELLRQKNIDTIGIIIQGKNFRWSGKYEFDMNQAHTLKTELNSLADFQAEIPESYKNAEFILLANNPPKLQLKVIEQLNAPKFIVVDSMNLWIQTAKESLLAVIKKANALVINDGEARMLFDTVSLVNAARQALSLGIQYCIIKKGEHGALLFAKDAAGKELHFNAAGYPLEIIKDPTGCGDCFAGGFIGYLAATNNLSFANIKKAVVYGSAIASFNAEDFSLNRMKRLTSAEINSRYKEFEKLMSF